MKKTLMLASLISVCSFAAVPAASADPSMAEPPQQWGAEQRASRLAEKLQLNPADAARLTQTMTQLRTESEPLRQQARAARQTLEKASQGDPASLSQVDQAIASLRDARARIVQLHTQRVTSFAQTLSPQQRAKMALAFEHRGLGRGGQHGRNRPAAE